jgi:hypothetical protein
MNIRLTLAMTLLCGTAFAQDLGKVPVDPYPPNSTSNPYSPAGSRHSPNSPTNPYGKLDSSYTSQSAANPYATEAPKLYDPSGIYHGRLSADPYRPDSPTNPYANPYGIGPKIESGATSQPGQRTSAANSAALAQQHQERRQLEQLQQKLREQRQQEQVQQKLMQIELQQKEPQPMNAHPAQSGSNLDSNKDGGAQDGSAASDKPD